MYFIMSFHAWCPLALFDALFFGIKKGLPPLSTASSIFFLEEYALSPYTSPSSLVILISSFTNLGNHVLSKRSIPTSRLAFLYVPETCFMIGDSGYDDHKLYDLSTKRGFQLVCPVQRYKNTPNNRLQLIEFYESELGQALYSWRGLSV